MRRHLDLAPNPYDARMEVVMPGIQERFNGLRTSGQHMHNSNLESHSKTQDAIKNLSLSSDQRHHQVVALFSDLNSNMNNLVHAQTQGMRTTMRLIDQLNVFQANRVTNLNLIDLHGVRGVPEQARINASPGQPDPDSENRETNPDHNQNRVIGTTQGKHQTWQGNTTSQLAI
jgi:hypothetical protein